MKPLHEELKEIRLDKGVTLEKIHELTKINPAFLLKIEEGDYSIVPQPFLRAFLREFAEVLDLDPDRVMKRYENKINYIREPEVSEQTPEDAVSEEKTAGKKTKKEQSADNEMEAKSMEQEIEPEKTEKVPDEPDLPVEVDTPEMTEPESMVQSPEIDSEATTESGQTSDTIKQPSLFDRSSESGREEPETTVQQQTSEILTEDAPSMESNLPEERKRLTVEEPEQSNVVYYIVFVVFIIIAALIIIKLSS